MNLYTKVRNFFESKMFTLLLVLVSACFVVFRQEAYGAIFLLNIGGAVLLFSENILTAFTPALLASTFVIKCYDSASLFLPLWWTAIFPIAAIIIYLVTRRRKITMGKSFYGILAVSVAVTLGGVFSISPAEYFSGASIYYVVMLGFGMLAAYLLIRSHVTENDRYDVFERFVDMMMIVGAFACFVVFEYYFANFSETFLLKKFANIQWSNNIATLLMMTMPFSLYRMRKSMWFFALFVVNYAAIVLAASRGGWLMGSAEFCICIAVGVFFMKLETSKKTVLGIMGVALIIAAVVTVIYLAGNSDFIDLILTRKEARIDLFLRSFEDFMKNPLFGAGLGCKSNADLYNGRQGTMTWYHMMIPQIVGSLGLVGMFCYGKQIVERFAIIFRKPDTYVLTLGLSYVGLLLMSQVNPGEFCPLPYELLAVLTFIMIEKYTEKS